VAKHDKFRDKHDLKVMLVADEAGKITEDYGVWVEKNMYGKTSMGIERATFLIDDKGLIRKIWRKVKAKGHAAEVLAAVK
jgi:peroxiredoxin Q/BCP